MYPGLSEYAEKLSSKMPGNLKACLFVNSGSEANDLAIYLSRLYTGRFDILSLRNGYHGTSPCTIGITSLSTWKYNIPSGNGMIQTMNPDVFLNIIFT
jgi:alanine-glyoxylate transaminase/(R)-3-amino-2-methylpropionate-pyruvate transaminase